MKEYLIDQSVWKNVLGRVYGSVASGYAINMYFRQYYVSCFLKRSVTTW